MSFPDIVKIIKGVYNDKEIEKFLSAEMKNASWGSVVVNTGIVFALSLAVQLTVFNYLYNEFLLSSLDPISASYYPPRTIATSVIDAFISILVFLPLFMLSIHLIAKIFKGKGELLDMTYLYTVLTLAFIFPSLIIVSLMMIPLLGCLIGLLSILFFIYTYYAYYKGIRLVYKIGQNGAIITLIASAIIATVATMVVGFVKYFFTF